MNLETAKELKHSILWTELVGEIDKRVVFETNKLKTCKPEELGILQAKVSCYEALTRLPADVIERES